MVKVWSLCGQNNCLRAAKTRLYDSFTLPTSLFAQTGPGELRQTGLPASSHDSVHLRASIKRNRYHPCGPHSRNRKDSESLARGD